MLVKLENGMYLHTYDSDNRPFEENCDCVCGFCLFNADYTYEDGGEFDFNSEEIITEENLLKKLKLQVHLICIFKKKLDLD